MAASLSHPERARNRRDADTDHSAQEGSTNG